jgi:predicted NodU family carbamoyl transferase
VRVHAVARATHPRLAALLDELGRATGAPVALEAPLADDTLACTARDALDLYRRSGLDAIALERAYVERAP